MGRDPLAGDVLKLTGERGTCRRRVGNWRILFDLSPGLGEVRYIERRTAATYRRHWITVLQPPLSLPQVLAEALIGLARVAEAGVGADYPGLTRELRVGAGWSAVWRVAHRLQA